MSTSLTDKVLIFIGLIGIVVCSYLLFFYTPKSTLQGTSVIGKIIPKGMIRRRVARSLYWENLTEPSTLYLRDIIYATKEATATVELAGGKKIELLPDSMIQLDEVSSDSINITLIEGQVKGPDAAAVVVKKEVQFRMPAYPTRGVTSVAVAGSIETIELRQSELVSRTRDFLKPKRNRILPKSLATFKTTEALDKLEYYTLELVRPLNVRYNLRANHWLEFVWTPVPLSKTRFVVEISRSPQFTSKLSHATRDTSLKLQIEEEGDYYWRVRSERGKDVRHSSRGEFHMSLRSGKTQELPVRIPASVPKGYATEIALDKAFKKLVRLEVTREPLCRRKGLVKGAYYYCRVKNLIGEEAVAEYGFTVR